MSDTAEWTDQVAGSQADDKSSAVTRAALLSVLILLLGLGASTWLYFGETRTLARLLAPSPAGAAHSSPQGGCGAPQAVRALGLLGRGRHGWRWHRVFAGVAAGLVLWKRAWKRRVHAWDQEWRKTTARLEGQLADSRKSEEQLAKSRADAQKRVAELESANSELQAELDRLKRAGKTLAQQQQALESSKTVLEVHVQARTKELQKLQRRYEHILNSAGEGICGLDAQGKTTFANPAVAKLTGWTLEELIGKTEHEIFGRNGADGQAAQPDDPSGRAGLLSQRRNRLSGGVRQDAH